ncbi:MAG: tetratricopeptide repeat protein [Actinomycetota bacterium]
MTQRRSNPKRKRIPPPPDRGRPDRDVDDAARDEVVIERVADQQRDQGPRKSKKKRNRTRQTVDVSHVEMPGVAPATATKLQRRLGEAAEAFDRERFTDAERLLQSIDRLAPGVPEVHELLGLTYYRLGRWTKTLKELERFAELTGSVEQHPVMADANRALKRWTRAEELWHELGDASPAPDLIEEGRIVQAGALADQGRLQDAIRFLERAPKVKGKPAIHHLRRWYVMADLYERAGDAPRARRLFADIARAEPAFGDAADRAVGF